MFHYIIHLYAEFKRETFAYVQYLTPPHPKVHKCTAGKLISELWCKVATLHWPCANVWFDISHPGGKKNLLVVPDGCSNSMKAAIPADMSGVIGEKRVSCVALILVLEAISSQRKYEQLSGIPNLWQALQTRTPRIRGVWKVIMEPLASLSCYLTFQNVLLHILCINWTCFWKQEWILGQCTAQKKVDTQEPYSGHSFMSFSS